MQMKWQVRIAGALGWAKISVYKWAHAGKLEFKSKFCEDFVQDKTDDRTSDAYISICHL